MNASTTEFVQAVKDYATRHYESDGWDILVECLDDADIAEIIRKASTVQEAIDAAFKFVHLHHQRRQDIRGA